MCKMFNQFDVILVKNKLSKYINKYFNFIYIYIVIKPCFFIKWFGDSTNATITQFYMIKSNFIKKIKLIIIIF